MSKLVGYTPGPWTFGDVAVWAGDPLNGGDKVALVLFSGENRYSEECVNRELIAAAPDLLAENERLRAEVDALKAEIRSLKDCLGDYSESGTAYSESGIAYDPMADLASEDVEK